MNPTNEQYAQLTAPLENADYIVLAQFFGFVRWDEFARFVEEQQQLANLREKLL